MVHFVGAGTGAVDLITVRGMKLLKKAEIIIYAGSLVNPELLQYADPACQIYNSATMTLDEVIEVIGANRDREIVRLHTGDPSIYGAIREQMDALDKLEISYETCPGVSACFGAAAALNMEYTLPGITQSLIITRMAGKTSVPDGESIESFASHGASMAIYLSAGQIEELCMQLLKGGYLASTPIALLYKVTWPDEQKIICTIDELPQKAREAGITKTAIVLVGDAVAQSGYEKSRLYAPDFSTEYREAKKYDN